MWLRMMSVGKVNSISAVFINKSNVLFLTDNMNNYKKFHASISSLFICAEINKETKV